MYKICTKYVQNMYKICTKYVQNMIQVFHVGHSLACKAAEINPENGDAHRWIAVLSFYRAEKDGPAAGARNLEG